MGNSANTYLDYKDDIDPFPLRFDTSAPLIFTIHFVSYVSPIPPYDLKADKPRFSLSGTNYMTTSIKSTKFYTRLFNLWLIVCAILSVLFWLLHFQNRQEKNLFWIALSTTVLTLSIYCISPFITISVSFIENRIYNLLGNYLINCFVIFLIPFLLIKVFKRTMNRKLLIVLVILFLLQLVMPFLPKDNSFIWVSWIIIPLIVCFYYVITSWKKLKGAQWAIVVGLIFSIFSIIVGLIIAMLFKTVNDSPYFRFILLSCFILSFPLSLLVYVSLRFKEIIKEVRLNAKQVVELSEEKKLHAENQQKILQEEVNKQTAELRQTLNNLNATQTQLIQSEKMASLGELTAGIAHEIQNPLNFMNNFSEVNSELIDELKSELAIGNMQQAIELAGNIKENEEKINHHGKRAESIVKGMLQHSRKSTGTKEPTDINALADEYMRLSYHGLRAKDKSFNAEYIIDLDPTLPLVNVIPQDIGRVFLNLFNNAFWACAERSLGTVNEKQDNMFNKRDENKNQIDEDKELGSPLGVRGNGNDIGFPVQPPTPKGEILTANYIPLVTLTTKNLFDHIEIIIHDNGPGIPQNIKDKIFQPFFTTKPTGQGTGLGLSLAYDIVKAHGGDIKVKSLPIGQAANENQKPQTEFVIHLPLL
ncbi:MAG: ATP-binding protein [Saprospiraceae bacterium]